jgi:hypothetical protein
MRIFAKSCETTRLAIRLDLLGMTLVSDHWNAKVPGNRNRQGPDALSAHHRPGYSLSGCVPAEPDSASPGTFSIRRVERSKQQPLDSITLYVERQRFPRRRRHDSRKMPGPGFRPSQERRPCKDYGTSATDQVMRYPTRAYQSDQQSFKIADASETAK